GEAGLDVIRARLAIAGVGPGHLAVHIGVAVHEGTAHAVARARLPGVGPAEHLEAHLPVHHRLAIAALYRGGDSVGATRRILSGRRVKGDALGDDDLGASNG